MAEMLNKINSVVNLYGDDIVDVLYFLDDYVWLVLDGGLHLEFEKTSDGRIVAREINVDLSGDRHYTEVG